jgi:anti-sigma factor RsiW
MSEPSPPPDDNAAASGDPDDAIVAALSDYLEGALAGAERAEVERKVAGDPAWQRVHAELTETRKVLSGLRKAPAPASFADGVAETIHRRSAGRFFARRTLGDRLPFGAVLAVAIAGLVVLAYVLWSSPTGSLKVDGEHAAPHGSAAVAPP